MHTHKISTKNELFSGLTFSLNEVNFDNIGLNLVPISLDSPKIEEKVPITEETYPPSIITPPIDVEIFPDIPEPVPINNHPKDYHWFYQYHRSNWLPFSVTDSLNLEAALISGDPRHAIVAVEGDRYDVHVFNRTRVAVYWDEEPSKVTRGSWFYREDDNRTYQPYSEIDCEQMESEFLSVCRDNRWHEWVQVGPQRLHMVFHSMQTMAEYGIEGGGGARVVQRGTACLNLSEHGDSDSDKSPCHVMFVLVPAERNKNSVDRLRRTVQLVMDRYADGGRIEFLPILWRPSVTATSMTTVPGLRQIMEDTMLNTLCYSGQQKCQSVLTTVATEMNRLRHLYASRHPDYSDGTYSVIGHGTAGIIAIDLVALQNDLSIKLCTPVVERYSVPRLEFDVGVVVLLGSPINVHLAGRNVRKLGPGMSLDGVSKGVVNLSHPMDPLGGRVELVIGDEWPEASEVMDRCVWGSGKGGIGARLLHSLRGTWAHIQGLTGTHWEQGDGVSVSSTPGHQRGCHDSGNERRRYDYVVQEPSMGGFNDYLVALESHEFYWESGDVALKIIQEIDRVFGISVAPRVDKQPRQRFSEAQFCHTDFIESANEGPASMSTEERAVVKDGDLPPLMPLLHGTAYTPHRQPPPLAPPTATATFFQPLCPDERPLHSADTDVVESINEGPAVLSTEEHTVIGEAELPPLMPLQHGTAYTPHRQPPSLAPPTATATLFQPLCPDEGPLHSADTDSINDAPAVLDTEEHAVVKDGDLPPLMPLLHGTAFTRHRQPPPPAPPTATATFFQPPRIDERLPDSEDTNVVESTNDWPAVLSTEEHAVIGESELPPLMPLLHGTTYTSHRQPPSLPPPITTTAYFRPLHPDERLADSEDTAAELSINANTPYRQPPSLPPMPTATNAFFKPSMAEEQHLVRDNTDVIATCYGPSVLSNEEHTVLGECELPPLMPVLGDQHNDISKSWFQHPHHPVWSSSLRQPLEAPPVSRQSAQGFFQPQRDFTPNSDNDLFFGDCSSQKTVNDSFLHPVTMNGQPTYQTNMDNPYETLINQSTFDGPFTCRSTMDNQSTNQWSLDNQFPHHGTLDNLIRHQENLDNELPHQKALDNQLPCKEVLDNQLPNQSTLDSQFTYQWSIDNQFQYQGTVDNQIKHQENLDNQLPYKEVLDSQLVDQGTLDSRFTYQWSLDNQFPHRGTLDNLIRHQENLDNEFPHQEALDSQLPPQRTLDNQLPPQRTLDNQLPPQMTLDNQLPPQRTLDNQLPSQWTLDNQLPPQRSLDRRLPYQRTPDSPSIHRRALDRSSPAMAPVDPTFHRHTGLLERTPSPIGLASQAPLRPLRSGKIFSAARTKKT